MSSIHIWPAEGILFPPAIDGRYYIYRRANYLFYTYKIGRTPLLSKEALKMLLVKDDQMRCLFMTQNRLYVPKKKKNKINILPLI